MSHQKSIDIRHPTFIALKREIEAKTVITRNFQLGYYYQEKIPP